MYNVTMLKGLKTIYLFLFFSPLKMLLKCAVAVCQALIVNLKVNIVTQ